MARHASQIWRWTLLLLGATTTIPVGALTLDELSPRIPTNAPILWKAETNAIPHRLMVYKKILPRVFPDATISNAIVLASLQDKHFPWSSDQEICVDYDKAPWGHACTFEISPKRAMLSYSTPNSRFGPTGIPDREALARTARTFASLLGLDGRQLSVASIITNYCEYGNACGLGLMRSRLVDGIDFYGDSLMQGFSVELGSRGQIRRFCLIWPELLPIENSPIASPEQIIACIRAQKTPLMLQGDERDYFGRVKSLARAKKVTITSIRLHYTEGIYGEEPKEGQELSNVVTPIAELEATADLEDGAVKIQLCSPIISTEAKRLLSQPPGAH